ncbi:MAG: O-methyltransferase [Clostridiales bacterium]|jgi:hypothetical protein|nr:O-methyltransferase [Clostridiales bacterium]
MIINNELETFIKQVKKEALEMDVPIMEDDTINYIKKYIVENKVKRILEIGTAVGYSGLNYLSLDYDISLVTIERDENRYLKALQNFKEAGLESRVDIIFKDALEVDINDKFDLIILDGAKGQNINFFNKFKKNLEANGTIITDNMYLHGYVNKDEEDITSRNLRALVRKIKDYHNFLEENEEYDSEILKIGDGIAVSVKHNNI